MPILTEKTCRYHIPKTGGTWVDAALRNAGLEPQALQQGGRGTRHWGSWQSSGLRELRGKIRYTIIRHPRTWLPSLYAWIVRTQRVAVPADHRFAPIYQLVPDNVYAVRSFRDWLNWLPEGQAGVVQAEYTCSVNFVGRFEALADSVCVALKTAGEPFDEELLRATPKLNTTAPDELPMWSDGGDLLGLARVKESGLFSLYGE